MEKRNKCLIPSPSKDFETKSSLIVLGLKHSSSSIIDSLVQLGLRKSAQTTSSSGIWSIFTAQGTKNAIRIVDHSKDNDTIRKYTTPASCLVKAKGSEPRS